MNEFFFNGKYSIQDMKCFVYGAINIPSVSEEIISENVPGRPQGSLTVKTGKYKDITFKVVLQVNTDDLEVLHDVVKWLSEINDNRLLVNAPGPKCYKVKYTEIAEFQRGNGFYRIDVKFVCNPFVYAINETESNLSTTLVNNIFVKGFAAFPRFTFNCPLDTGINIIIDYNSTGVTLEGCKGVVTLDSELMMANSTVTGNVPVIGDYIRLKSGTNQIKITAPTSLTSAKMLLNEVFKG